MAWIETVSDEDAKGLVKRYYEASKKRNNGRVSESLVAFSINETHLRAATTIRSAAMEEPSGLSPMQRQCIAVRVSTLNECHH